MDAHERMNQQRREYYKKNRLKVSGWIYAWRAKNKQRYLSKRRAWYHRARTREEFLYRTRVNRKALYQRLKAQLLIEYGGRCVCCGETEPAFLTIDHIYGGGNIARRVRAGINLYYDLRRKNWPKLGYQLLCMNCNFATRFGRPCPHKKQSSDGRTPVPLD